MQLFDAKYSGILKNEDANMNRYFRKHAKGMLNVEKHSLLGEMLLGEAKYQRDELLATFEARRTK